MPGKRSAGRCKAVKPETRPRELAWSSERLVSECCKGNQAAWSALIDKYKNLIFSIPIKFGLSRDDAADICQAVCVDLLSDLPRLREPRALPKWLMQASYHKCLRFRRQKLCLSFMFRGLAGFPGSTAAIPRVSAIDRRGVKMKSKTLASAHTKYFVCQYEYIRVSSLQFGCAFARRFGSGP